MNEEIDMARASKIRELIADLLRMRTAAVEAAADFYKKLMEVEDDERSWKGDPKAGTGYVTFADLLVRENVADVACYSRFKAAVDRFGWEKVRAIGVPQSVSLVEVPSETASRVDEKVGAGEAAMMEVLESRTRNGVPPSPRQVQAIIGKHYVRPHEIRPRETVDERIDALRKENATLKRENKRLAGEVDRLSREVDRYENAGDRSQAKSSGKTSAALKGKGKTAA
jgi:hypothetical protein